MLQPSLCDLGKLCFLLSCFSVLVILKIYNMLLLDVDCRFKITKPCGTVLDDANWITLTKAQCSLLERTGNIQVVFGSIACPKSFNWCVIALVIVQVANWPISIFRHCYILFNTIIFFSFILTFRFFKVHTITTVSLQNIVLIFSVV